MEPELPKQIDPIRTETVLSKLPIHVLSSSRGINIQISKSANGREGAIYWDVQFGSKVKEPKALAYKIDTLIINRAIEEEEKRLGELPELIPLGSLKDISLKLGREGKSERGTNGHRIKKALQQNASAIITARLSYRDIHGNERDFEGTFARYSVIFSGERLADGRRADQVYVLLNKLYHGILVSAPRRPLDYSYMRDLKPTSQRFYEILSYRVYAALQAGNTEAVIDYSEYCLYSAQQRHFEYEDFRVQMYKVHKPHLDSQYLKSARASAKTDDSGNPDWRLVYEIGPRAYDEYRAFSRRNPQQTKLIEEPNEFLRLEEGRESRLLDALLSRGILRKQAEKLLAGRDLDLVADQLEWADSIVASGSLRNPPGFYVSVIKDGLLPPASFETSRARALRLEMEEARERKLQDHQTLELAYQNYKLEQLDAYLASGIAAAELQLRHSRIRAQIVKDFPTLPAATIEEIVTGMVRKSFLSEVEMLDFETFLAEFRDQVLSQNRFLGA